MGRFSGRHVVLGAAALTGGLAVTAWAGQWKHARHDVDGSSRSTGAARMSSAMSELPAISNVVDVTKKSLGDVRLADVDEDGEPEAVIIYRGRVAAINLATGALDWSSIGNNLDTILAIGDQDNDGTTEVLASSAKVGGAIHAYELASGALLGSLGGLDQRSGVDATEVSLYDLDGDGYTEIAYPGALTGLEKFWVSSPIGGFQNPDRLEAGFSGYSSITPLRVGKLLAGGQPSVVVDQGREQTVFAACKAGDQGAVCGTDPQTPCLCPLGKFEDVHVGPYAFGTDHVLDVDGDGVEELLSIASHPNWTNAISLLDFADGLEGGTPDSGALRTWYRRYDGASPPTAVLTPPQPPIDLDGNGSIDLVVTFVNNIDLDSDFAGASISDGIDLPGGISFAIFDAKTGAVQLSVENAFAYGWADLNGDDKPELITSPTSSWTYQTGLTGSVLACPGPCSLQAVWNAPNHTLMRDIGDLDGIGVPLPNRWRPSGDAQVHTLDSDEDGDAELVVYKGASLELLDNDGGVQVKGSYPLAPLETARAVDSETGHVLTASDTHMRLLDRTLAPIHAAVELPLQGFDHWSVTSLEVAADPVPVFESRVYPDGLGQPGSSFSLLPRFALADDLNGDGVTELISFRNPNDDLGPGFEVRAENYDIDAAEVSLVWSRKSSGDPDLDGYQTYGPLHYTVGDFDGAGARDVAFAMFQPGKYRVAVLNGENGEVLDVLAPTGRLAVSHPLTIADLTQADGALGTDGIDDILALGPSRNELLTLGYVGPVSSTTSPFFERVGSAVDLDGDGIREILTTISSTTDNRMAALSLQPPHTPLWGPQPLGLPAGYTEVLAAAEVDMSPGLDPIYLTGNASVEAYAGTTGAMLAGYPVYLESGVLSESPLDDPAVLSAIIVIDVDDDGYDEAVIGSADGWVYALNTDLAEASPPELEWAVEVADGVGELAAGDVDADGYDEILVSTYGGQGIVLDNLGAFLSIEDPGPDDCVENVLLDVFGDSSNLQSVDLFVAGMPAEQDINAQNGNWNGQVMVPGGPGEYEIRAEGFNDKDKLVALATRKIQFDGDDDADGVTVCGGDCAPDDPDVYPGAPEVCGDGVDQDCDDLDLECPAEETGDAGSDTSDETGGDEDDGTGDAGADDGTHAEGGCGCGVPREPGGLLWLLIAATPAMTRRRRRRRAV